MLFIAIRSVTISFVKNCKLAMYRLSVFANFFTKPRPDLEILKGDCTDAA